MRHDGSRLCQRSGLAVMHAAGHSNIVFFEWFYRRAHAMAERGFEWNQKNDATRNMLSMVKQAGSHPDMLNWCEDLAKRQYLSTDFFPERCSDG